MTAIRQITGQFSTLSNAAKIGIGIVIVAFMFGLHYLSGRWNLFHDTKFNEKIQEKLQQADNLGGRVEELTKQHDEAIKRAEEAESREQDLIQETLLYKAAAEAASKREAAVVDKLADEEKRYAEEVEQQSNTVLSTCDRWLANCNRAIKIVRGFKGPCNCDQIQAAK